MQQSFTLDIAENVILINKIINKKRENKNKNGEPYPWGALAKTLSPIKKPSREKQNRKNPLTREGGPQNTLRTNALEYGSSVFGTCTHLARAACGYKIQVVVGLLLAHSSSIRGTLTQSSKPQRIKSDLAAVLRLQTNRALELFPAIPLGFKAYLIQIFFQNS